MSQYGGSNALLPGQNPSMGGLSAENWKEQLARTAAALAASSTNYNGFVNAVGGGSMGYSHHSLNGNGQQNYSALSSLQNAATNGGNYCAQQQIGTQQRWGGGVRLPTTPHSGNGANWDPPQPTASQVHSGSNGSTNGHINGGPNATSTYLPSQGGPSPAAINAYAAAQMRNSGHLQHPQMETNSFGCLSSPSGPPQQQWITPASNERNSRLSQQQQLQTPPYHLQHSAFSPRSVNSAVSPQENFGSPHGPQSNSAASGVPSEGFGHSPRIQPGSLPSPRGNPLPSPVTLLSSSLELEYLKSLTSSLPQANPGKPAQFPYQPTLNSGGTQLKAPQPQHQTVALPSSLQQQNYAATTNGTPKPSEIPVKQEAVRDDNTIEAAKAILSFQQGGNSNGRLYESILSTNNNSVDNNSYQPISPVSSAGISPTENAQLRIETESKVNGGCQQSPSAAIEVKADEETDVKADIPRLEVVEPKWDDSGFIAVKVEEKTGDDDDCVEPPVKLRRMSPRDEAATPPATGLNNGPLMQIQSNPMSFPLTPTPIINAASHKGISGQMTEEGSDGRRKELPTTVEGSFTTPSSRQESRSSSPHSGSSRAGAETPHSTTQMPTAPSASMPLAGLSVITAGVIPSNVHTCHICGFTSASKFHFNSHMNTHTDHKCDFCDYTSRTEGRLKRHMKDFHAARPDGASGSQPSGHDSNSPNEFEPDPECNSDLDMSRDSLSPGTPGRNRSNPSVPSKPKVYKCKQCAYVAPNKNDFWSHAETHIKPDKRLTCPKCSFVTEYKHHLEYHLRNHYGSKPFKCNKCNYSCVNKSMLNSHMKSHSNIYQYRCNDCTYATKYCHSLKLHLRKYGHTPATVINPDGSMIDASTIDVYGNRRGPRPKKGSTPPLGSINNLLQSTFNGAGPSHSQEANNMPTTPLVPFMEALQSTLLAQAVAVSQHQQNGVVNGGPNGSMGATLPTIASLSDYSGANGGLIHLPTSHGSFSSGSSMMSASPRQQAQLNSSSSNLAHIYKCSMCEYVSHTREALTQHIMVHIVENKELCHMYGISSDNIPALAAQLAGAIRSTLASSVNGSAANPMVNGGMDSTRPGSEPMYRQTNSQPQPASVQNGRGRLSSNAAMLNSVDSSPTDDHSRFSPGQELTQDGTSPASVSGGAKSGDDDGCGGAFGNEFSAAQPTRRRKAKAYKLDRIALKLQGKLSPSPSPHDSGTEGSGQFTPDVDAAGNHGNSAGSQQTSSTPNATQGRFSHGEPIVLPPNANGHKIGPVGNSLLPEETGADWSKAYVCHYCDIAFKDCIMYTIHMGYHGYQDPFKCNMCGQISQDRLAMFLHIARAPHS